MTESDSFDGHGDAADAAADTEESALATNSRSRPRLPSFGLRANVGDSPGRAAKHCLRNKPPERGVRTVVLEESLNVPFLLGVNMELPAPTAFVGLWL